MYVCHTLVHSKLSYSKSGFPVLLSFWTENSEFSSFELEEMESIIQSAIYPAETSYT
jgi:TfoX/Sxy family transcriptional regulator of competence genes